MENIIPELLNIFREINVYSSLFQSVETKKTKTPFSDTFFLSPRTRTWTWWYIFKSGCIKKLHKPLI
ncbi:hypothetical protein HanPSC8_Chr16g0704301 [Helianthus annuus]|nr:hypothetical protein HanPSC8_Chr16g0704301 [Helianthus annuus]